MMGYATLSGPGSSPGNGNTCIIETWFFARARRLSDFKGIKNGAIKLHLLLCSNSCSGREIGSYNRDCLPNTVEGCADEIQEV